MLILVKWLAMFLNLIISWNLDIAWFVIHIEIWKLHVLQPVKLRVVIRGTVDLLIYHAGHINFKEYT